MRSSICFWVTSTAILALGWGAAQAHAQTHWGFPDGFEIPPLEGLWERMEVEGNE